MREIKFRAWDYDEEIMRKNWTDISIVSSDRIILMQYTGLKDKNGKEIYEGDIVKGYFDVDEVEDYIYIGLSDEEKKEGMRVFNVKDIHWACGSVPEVLEVIGNIYENHPVQN